MPAARTFTELQFWQRARAWSRDIFHATKRQPFARDQRLVVQINDSSESVMSNMAEGFGRGTQEEFITFLGYALGSLDETQSHLTAAYDREYLAKEEYAAFFREGTAIRKLTVAFIRAMIMPRSGVRKSRQAAELVESNVGNLRTSHRPETSRAL
jgi:four helix bundle protein